MTPLGLIFFIIAALATLAVPRRFAAIPLAVCACWMTNGQKVEIGSLGFSMYRLLIVVGLLRCLIRGEGIKGGLQNIDKLMFAFGGWIIFASFFHLYQEGSGPTYATGSVLNVLGLYFLIRIWCSEPLAIKTIIMTLAIVLVPVGLEMIFELKTGKNLFSILGRVSENVVVRHDKLRAQGPFPHPILAGTVGAVCVPLMISIWKEHRIFATTGIFACIAMVFASASSGPIISLAAGIGAVILWRWRHLTSMFRWAAVGMYILLEIVMERPAYFIISKIDLTGSSASYHRSKLIESAFKYVDEWWLFGTDYTRHWMPFGVSFSANHTDVTNYYLAFAVNGGLPAMLLLILILWKSFRRIGINIQAAEADAARSVTGIVNQPTFYYWCLGSALFSHAVTSISIAYMSQSMFFFWFSVAVIGSLAARPEPAMAVEPCDEPGDEDPWIVPAPARRIGF